VLGVVDVDFLRQEAFISSCGGHKSLLQDNAVERVMLHFHAKLFNDECVKAVEKLKLWRAR
jgi:hypothetical protein